MKRTRNTPKEMNVLLQVATRMALAQKLGEQYGGKRDVYEALGYPKDLTAVDYYAQYSRQDIAGAIIDKPIKKTWRGEIRVMEADSDETDLEAMWKILNKGLKLKSKFVRLDKLTSLNTYGVLVLGFSDVQEPSQMMDEVVASNSLELIYVKPYGSRNVQIKQYEEDVSNPRYGLPLIYEIEVNKVGGDGTDKLKIHQSRILHVAMDLLEDEVEGTPVLQKVFNRLKDLEKIVGGSAEMYWRGARPGYQGKVDKEYVVGETMMKDLQEQIDEYENDLRRILVNEGVSLEAMETQVSSPKDAGDIQIQMISAVTGIPKRILTGSERGELSSTQDNDAWLTLIQDRREEFAEPEIVRAFIDRLITLKVLPEAKDTEGAYDIVWPDLFSSSQKEKVALGKERATALKDYTTNPLADAIIPPEVFVRYFLGLTESEADKVSDAIDLQAINEQNQIEEDTVIE